MLFSYLLATGVTTGALYALVAVGLVICYRTTGHINFAHGELFMVGGYIAFSINIGPTDGNGDSDRCIIFSA